MTELLPVLSTLYLIAEYAVKIAAIGFVPENRRPSSSTAWLLLILTLPVVGLPLFFVLGSPMVRGRRHAIQAAANRSIAEDLAHIDDVPVGFEVDPGMRSTIALNRNLTAMPCVTGINHGIRSDYEASIAAMAEAVDAAERYVHVEIYIMAWDHTTDVFFTALARAVERGVIVRLLLDHIGSRKYPGFKRLGGRLDAAGIQWRLMMPIQPLHGRWRRPDLRNHRKLLVVDGNKAFMGSQNMIDSTYLSKKNQRVGRHWHDVMVELSGQIVAAIEAVFAVDWYTESGERIRPDIQHLDDPALPIGGQVNALQLIPSGPGFETEPNLRLFDRLIQSATERLAVVSPYFVPDESLFYALTTAAHRGVDVELYVCEEADQIVVGHAQASYYQVLLEAGIRILRYPKPAVLHSKFFTVDDKVAVFGSSNLDMRSFGLDYEITLMAMGGNFVADLDKVLDEYRAVCSELTLEEWQRRPWHERYLNNVFRLTSALM